MFKKIIILICLVLTLSVTTYADDSQYELITTNENYTLYLDSRTLNILLIDNSNNHKYYSSISSSKNLNKRWDNFFNSGLSIEYVTFLKNNQYKVATESINTSKRSTINISKHQDGFSALLSFAESDIKLTLKTTLTNEGLKNEILSDSIIEDGSKKLVSVSIYPGFSATKAVSDNAYYVIPDQDGALVNLDKVYNNVRSPYSATYYNCNYAYNNCNNDNLTLPIYGVIAKEEEAGYYSVINKGVSYANLNMSVAGVITDYYYINNKYLYRQQYEHFVTPEKKSLLISSDRNEFDIEEEYIFLQEYEADYSGIANHYRSRLTKENKLAKLEATSTIDILLEVIVSSPQAGVFGNSAIEMTNANNLLNIVTKLEEQAVSNINISLFGATTITNSGKPNDRNKINTSLLDNSTMEDIQAKDSVKSMSLQTSYIATLGIPSPINRNTDIIRLYNNTINQSSYQFGAVNTNIFYLNGDGFYKMVESDIKDLDNTYLNGVTTDMPSASDSFNTSGIKDATYAYNRILEGQQLLGDNYDYLTLFNPVNDNYAKVDAIAEIEATTTRFPYMSETIPFRSLVLKGSVDLYATVTNYTSNSNLHQLKMLEYGLFPTYLVSENSSNLLQYTKDRNIVSSQFSDWEQDIVESYHITNDVLSKVNGSYMINHEILDNKLVKVEYENGVVILINYENKVLAYENHKVKPLGYEVINFE